MRLHVNVTFICSFENWLTQRIANCKYVYYSNKFIWKSHREYKSKIKPIAAISNEIRANNIDIESAPITNGYRFAKRASILITINDKWHDDVAILFHFLASIYPFKTILFISYISAQLSSSRATLSRAERVYLHLITIKTTLQNWFCEPSNYRSLVAAENERGKT